MRRSSPWRLRPCSAPQIAKSMESGESGSHEQTGLLAECDAISAECRLISAGRGANFAPPLVGVWQTSERPRPEVCHDLLRTFGLYYVRQRAARILGSPPLAPPPGGLHGEARAPRGGADEASGPRAARRAAPGGGRRPRRAAARPAAAPRRGAGAGADAGAGTGAGARTATCNAGTVAGSAAACDAGGGDCGVQGPRCALVTGRHKSRRVETWPKFGTPSAQTRLNIRKQL